MTKKQIYFFISATLLSIAIWYKFTYPQFAFIDLSVDKNTAFQVAEKYLSEELQVDTTQYRHATAFIGNINADRYLQKAMGFNKSLEFIEKHDFEYFFWRVRFYKENEIEQYRVTVSAATGEITNFTHSILATEARDEITQTQAQEKSVEFLKKKFQFNPDDYILHSHFEKKHDNRTDFSFVWEKKGVYIPWSDEPNTGGAKLLVGTKVSGDEILTFNKMSLDIPQEFHVYLARLKTVGTNLAVVFRMLFFLLLTSSIFYVVVRRNDLVMHTTKKFCVGITLFIFFLNLLTYFNEFESVLYNYRPTSSFSSYLWRSMTQFIMDTFIVTISILMPCLAGESLHYETLREKKEGSFLHFILSSFQSRKISSLILLGYFVAIIMIGIQSFAFEFGQRYLNVWVEYTWMAQLSSSFFPFLTAFILGFVAGSTEEICFRLFSISFGKKFLKSTVLAVLFSSLLWGYGHSTYLVFPMWFRGLEVTLMGIFLAVIYLRYGIVTVLVAHYLFDVFWVSSAYLLGTSTPYHFYSALAMLLLPLIYAGYAYLRNASTEEKQMHWKLTKHQLFNLNVLKHYLKDHPVDVSRPIEEVKREIKNHGWDISVVELALEDPRKPENK